MRRCGWSGFGASVRAWARRAVRRCKRKCSPIWEGRSGMACRRFEKLRRVLPRAEREENTQSIIEPASKRYEHIKDLRETHFGAQASALFIVKTPTRSYSGLIRFAKNAALLAVEERFAALDKLQADAQLGEDRPSLLSADARYQQALGLLNEVEQARWRTALQQRYFGKEAEAVAHYEQQQSAQQKLQSRYEEAVQQLNRRYEGRAKTAKPISKSWACFAKSSFFCPKLIKKLQKQRFAKTAKKNDKTVINGNKNLFWGW